MGECYIAVDLDIEEWLDPFKLGSGCKFVEQLLAQRPVDALCALLVVEPTGRSAFGRWAADRIVVLGAYAEGGPFGPCPIYSACRVEGRYLEASSLFKDHSDACDLRAMLAVDLDLGEAVQFEVLSAAGIPAGQLGHAVFKLLARDVPHGYSRKSAPWGRWAGHRIAITTPQDDLWLRVAAKGAKDISHEVVVATKADPG